MILVSFVLFRPSYSNNLGMVKSNPSESRGEGIQIKIRKNKNGFKKSPRNMDNYKLYYRSFLVKHTQIPPLKLCLLTSFSIYMLQWWANNVVTGPWSLLLCWSGTLEWSLGKRRTFLVYWVWSWLGLRKSSNWEDLSVAVSGLYLTLYPLGGGGPMSQ